MELKENVIIMDSTIVSHCFLIYDNGWIFIDISLGFSGKNILKELEQLKINPHEIKHILLTHHDTDHTGNLKLLKDVTGATVWAHKEDIPFITGEKDRPGFKKHLGNLLNSKNKIQDIQPFKNDMKIGNIKIYHTPGHSPGHVCMLFEDVLFVGDLVENKRGNVIPYPKFWNWDTDRMLESIKRLNHINFSWICPAHGKPVQQDKLPIV